MKLLTVYHAPGVDVLNDTLAEEILVSSTDSVLDLDGQDLDFDFGGDW